MNLPYEENPEPAYVDEGMISAGGLVVAGATTQVGNHTYPALLFRFALPDGEFAPPILLVAMPDQLEDLVPLVRSAVTSAVKAAGA